MSVSIGRAYLLRRFLSIRLPASTAVIIVIAAQLFLAASPSQAKTPGKTYCYHGICHRVLTLSETRRRVGKRTSVIASYYSHCRVDRFNPCGLTSSGARFRPSHADNAASPIYPNGTKLLVWNPANRRAAVIRIDNAGPYWRNRKLDLSRAAAEKLGFRRRGVARLIVQVLEAPTRRQARYRRYRRYAPVKGYMGRFASLAGALRSAGHSPSRPRIPLTVAGVVLPVPNTFMAERRIWLARMVETGPVSATPSAGMAVRPKIRLPVRLVRAELPPATVLRRARKPRRIAAVSSKRIRKAAPRKKSVRVSKKAKPAPQKRARKTKQIAAAAAPAKKPQPAANQNKPQAAPAQPTAAPRPKMAWRTKFLGINKGGA